MDQILGIFESVDFFANLFSLDNQVQPIIEKKFAKSKFLPGAKLGALAMICAACFYAVLPVSVAAFPQYVTMDKSGIEPELAKKVSGQTVIYNRGQ